MTAPPTVPTLESLIDRVSNDHVRGASELARLALDGLRTCALETPSPSRQVLEATGQALRDCRPAMAPIRNLMQQWLDRISADPATDEAWLLAAAAHAENLCLSSKTAVRRIALLACRLLPSGWTLMTHSLSSTVLALANARHKRKTRQQWLVSRSEPEQEGLELARRLAALEQSVLVFTEAQGGLIMRDANVLVVGADAILANGDLINKSGTYLLALAAADQGVPVLCLCETFKYSDSNDFDPEPHALDHLSLPASQWISGYNFTFDRTPAKLISAVLSEDGLSINRCAQVPWQTA
ncbi:translation initiation factor eIF-2B [Mangrovitalea sediminis]|uniref:translation initiation factor eIF-2B n=1 Tax=Mangrovitalea sediminis TaxID=1982043 RepID=UPI00130427B5|nr:hypothetical protein [Mangrovitalea sediminis]